MFRHFHVTNGRMVSQLKNVLVIGGSYVGTRAALELATALPPTHRVFLIEPHSHFQHLFAFPRFAVVPGLEHKAFIPYDRFFASKSVPDERGQIVRASVDEVRRDVVVLDREIGGSKELPYDYAVIATGTKLPPPGTLKVEGKVEGIEYFRQHQKRIANAQHIVVLGGGAVGVQMSTDIKEYYPSKEVTLVHSREKLMSRFHPKLHDVVAARCEELGIRLVLGDRAIVPAEGFPVEEGRFDVALESGKKIATDFAIISIGQTPQSSLLTSISPDSIESNGFVSVLPTMQIADPDLPNIFVVGDIADSGAQKSARAAGAQPELVAKNIARLIADDDKELGTFSSTPAGIHMTLGIKRNVVFRDPGPGQPEPQWMEKDDGTLEMRIEKRWTDMGASLDDFHA